VTVTMAVDCPLAGTVTFVSVKMADACTAMMICVAAQAQVKRQVHTSFRLLLLTTLQVAAGLGLLPTMLQTKLMHVPRRRVIQSMLTTPPTVECEGRARDACRRAAQSHRVKDATSTRCAAFAEGRQVAGRYQCFMRSGQWRSPELSSAQMPAGARSGRSLPMQPGLSMSA